MTCCAKLLQSCLTLCNSMDCSLAGSSVHRILQARTLERVAISCSANLSVNSWAFNHLVISLPLPINISSQERMELNMSPFLGSLTCPLQSMGLTPREWKADAGTQRGQASALLARDGRKALNHEGLVPSITSDFMWLSALVLLGITLTWTSGWRERSWVASGIFGISQAPSLGLLFTI